MKKSILVFAGLALSSCASDPVLLTEAFDEAEAEEQIKDGKNTIEGSAVWREKKGGVQKCSGYRVYLYPATKYAEERAKHLFGERKNGSREASKEKVVFIPDEKAFHRLSRRTVCDVDGKFEFENVGDGDYFLTTKIVWGNPDEPDEQTEGGNLMQKISVKGGQKIKVVLSPYL